MRYCHVLIGFDYHLEQTFQDLSMQVPAALLLSHNKYNNKHENNEHKKSEHETEDESNKIDTATSKY